MAKYYLKLGDRQVDAEVQEDAGGLRVNLGDGWRTIDLARLGDSPRFSLNLDHKAVDVLALEGRDSTTVVIAGVAYEIATARPQRGRGRQEEDDDGHFVNGRWSLRSPITGSVVEVRVAEGDVIEAGAVIMVVEAMKMQNELRSRVSGRVMLKAEKGQRVETGAVVAEVSALGP